MSCACRHDVDCDLPLVEAERDRLRKALRRLSVWLIAPDLSELTLPELLQIVEWALLEE